MSTGHRQVDCLDFACDEEIAELVELINACGITTLLSCQDNDGGRGTVRRVWVQILPYDLLPLLDILDRAGEAGTGDGANLETLSNRMAAEFGPEDWEEFGEDRAWHYSMCVSRVDGRVDWTVGIRFPYTDLAEVTARLREAAG